jgi:hypothetical protein
MPYYICNPINKVNLINFKPDTIVFNYVFRGSSRCLFWRATKIQVLLFLALKLTSFTEAVGVHFGNQQKFKSALHVNCVCLLSLKENVK